jgi:glycosyltransferase involved in cell wall biosynthesis
MVEPSGLASRTEAAGQADHVHGAQSARLRVLMIAEGSYPYHFGGVSTWCHSLIRGLPDVDFWLMSLISDPRLDPLYTLPANVVELLPVPLWGVVDSQEAHHQFTRSDLSRRRRTTDAVIVEKLIPVFSDFLVRLWEDLGDPSELALLVHRMHRFALEYDLNLALRSRPAWEEFVEVAEVCFPRAAAAHGRPDATFSLADIQSGAQWMRHLLFPIARPLPPVDVAHAAMAGPSTLVAVCAKLEHKAAFMLTEHGIFLREAYLAASTSSASVFLKLLRVSFARRVTELSYSFADQISPCCDYNQRWELRLGADPKRLRTLSYGVDSSEFQPADRPPSEHPPVVVWVGRINPLKDLRTLLEAAALVSAERHDVRFLLFGSAANEDEGYFQEIQALRASLGLDDVVEFRGYVAHPAAAYNEGDVVVLSSLSEGFPFSILEAMLCGKPIVATAVGGIPEQVEGCGLAVEPRNPPAMARGILELLNDPQRCAALGRAARLKAMGQYSIEMFCGSHRESYLRLSGRIGRTPTDRSVVQRLTGTVRSPRAAIPASTSRSPVLPTGAAHRAAS